MSGNQQPDPGAGNSRGGCGCGTWLTLALVLFVAYRSLFWGDAHEIGPVRDRIAGAFDTFGLLPQASGFDGEHGLGGKTTLIHRQMVQDPAYAQRMIALTGVELPNGPRDAEWWNVLIIRLVPIDSDVKAAVSYYAESKLCTLDPVKARNYTSQCVVAPPPELTVAPQAAAKLRPTSEPAIVTEPAPTSVVPLRTSCEVGSGSYRHVDSSTVICGCDYTSYEHSRDGTNVCAGGRYDGYEHSRDGRRVACGGLYTGYEHSRDGSDVCAGGRYTGYEHSRDGRRVACGGLFTGYEHSRDGGDVCAGGRYTGYEHSRDGRRVACGGLYTGYERSRDGSMTCYGGLYR